MSKKTAIFITLLAAIIAIAGFIAWYLFLSPQGSSTPNPIQDLVSKFFPQGQTPGIQNQNDNQGQTNTNQTGAVVTENQPAPIVRKISEAPVSGFIVLENKKDGPTARYQETETGNVYSAPLSVITTLRLTNTTIPKVRESVWLPGGDLLVSRYLDDDYTTIKSFSGKVNPKKSDLGTISEGSFDGSFLRDGIVEMVSGPLANKIFYLVVESGGGAGIIANADGSKATRVFSSPLREWLPQWIGESTVYLTTKPSARAIGYLYSLNTVSSAQTKILGGISGLTTNASPKNTALLYSNSALRLFALDLKTKKETELPVQTLPEKCAWDQSNADVVFCGVPNQLQTNEYPDSWYKGLVHFTDSLWKINIKTQEMTLVATFSDVTSDQFDIIKPSLDKNGSYIIFVNKNDGSLWSVKVK
jgi:hypothetical protein